MLLDYLLTFAVDSWPWERHQIWRGRITGRTGGKRCKGSKSQLCLHLSSTIRRTPDKPLSVVSIFYNPSSPWESGTSPSTPLPSTQDLGCTCFAIGAALVGQGSCERLALRCQRQCRVTSLISLPKLLAVV